MADQPPSPGRPSSKRRACAKCARLKMRCLWPTEDNVTEPEACIRCARMGLTCSVPASVPRKKRVPSTRVAQLERRIDGIISLLSTGQESEAGRNTASIPLTPDSTTTNKSAQAAIPTNTRSRHVQNVASSVPDDTTLEILPNFRLSTKQAAAYLATYRNTMMANYPFVIIPHNVDAYELSCKSKCLFWSIMATVAPLTPETQQDFKLWFRRHLAEEIVVKQQKRLELLQAILIHLAWGDFQFYVDMPTTSILQLANSLVVDLKLDKAPGDTFLPSQSLLADAWKCLEMRIPLEPNHTLHEKRAVLGYFHVSSPAASLFRRGPHLPWTGYLDRCCEALEKAGEYETDFDVVTLARLHRTAEYINTIYNPDSTAEPPKHLRAPVFMAIERIEGELKSILAAHGGSGKPNSSIMRHYHILVMRLYEPLLNMSATPLNNPSSSTSEPFQRGEGLWRCLHAASAYFNTQLSVKNSELSTLPFTGIGLAAFAIVTSSRLLLLDNNPDWNAAAARGTFDFAGALARMGDQVEESDRIARDSGHSQRLFEDGDGLASRYCFKVRWIRQWYLAKLPEAERAAMDVSTGTVPGGVPMVPGQFGDMHESLWDGFLMSMDPSWLSVALSMGPDQLANGTL